MQTTVIYTTGEPGSGKSYYRCMRFLIDDFLRNTSCKHVSNFPVRMEPWEKDGKPQQGFAAVAKAKGLNPDDVRERVLVFDPADVESWLNLNLGSKGGGHVCGPWDQLDQVDISGFHIAIDEIHNFCGTKSAKSVQARWAQWLGEIRHQGATVEFLTQSPKKVASCITEHAGLRHRLLKGEEREDFWFKIPLYDWYQLRAKFVGRWKTCFWQVTERNILDKWKTSDQKKFRLDPEYFEGYDSHSAPISGATAGNERPREWQTMSWPRLLAWFVSRNDAKLLLRGALLALIPTLAIGGPWIAPVLFGIGPWWMSHVMSSKADPRRHQAIATEEVAAAIRETHAQPRVTDANMAFRASATPVQQAKTAAAATSAHVQTEPVIEGAAPLRLSLITPETITLSDGATYAIGEHITSGDERAALVRRIDFEKRAVYLHDGRCVHLGGELHELPNDAPARQLHAFARVRRPVPATASGGQRVDATARLSDGGPVGELRPNADDGVLPLAGQSSRRQHHLRTADRPSAGDDRRH